MVPQKVQLLAGENIVQVSCLYPSLLVGFFPAHHYGSNRPVLHPLSLYS